MIDLGNLNFKLDSLQKSSDPREMLAEVSHLIKSVNVWNFILRSLDFEQNNSCNDQYKSILDQKLRQDRTIEDLVVNLTDWDESSIRSRAIIKNFCGTLISKILAISFHYKFKKIIFVINENYFNLKSEIISAFDTLAPSTKPLVQLIPMQVTYIYNSPITILNVLEGFAAKPVFSSFVGDDEYIKIYGKLVLRPETIIKFFGTLKSESKENFHIHKNKSETNIYGVYGSIEKPGIYECDENYLLHKLIYEDCGGIIKGRKMKAVFINGLFSKSVHASQSNLTLKQLQEFDYYREYKTGTDIVVIDETQCMVKVAIAIARSFLSSACGTCVPCPINAKIMYQMLEKLESGLGQHDDILSLLYTGSGTLNIGRCSLMANANQSILNIVNEFRSEFEQHITEGNCPFGNSE